MNSLTVDTLTGSWFGSVLHTCLSIIANYFFYYQTQMRGPTSTNFTKDELDLHRALSLRHKNNEIYRNDEGLIARYGGYVPGKANILY